MVVFNSFTSVHTLKSCAIDTDLSTTSRVVTRLARDGEAGADLDEQVYVQMTLPEPEMCHRHSLLAQEIG